MEVERADQVGAAWIFARGSQRLEVRRSSTDIDSTLEIELLGSSPRLYRFSDLLSLTRFQCDMEQFLVNTGWSLKAFVPERRSGRDRRMWPRLSERRRWWTGPS